MKEKKTKKKIDHEKTSSVNKVTKIKVNKKRIKPMLIVDYAFLISLVLSIIFGIQTNTNFFIPFVIVLTVTLVCMVIILVNAIVNKIKKLINKRKKED